MNPFGSAGDDSIELATLANAQGAKLGIITLGASIRPIRVHDRDGHFAGVVIGYSKLEGYLERPQYFGAMVGSIASRIANLVEGLRPAAP